MYSESKIAECHFFLEALRKSSPHQDEFSFYLSALVSAFRSISFAMQAEYCKNSLCADIYSELQSDLKEDMIANDMKNARNDQQHQGHHWPRVITRLSHPDSGVVEFEAAPLPSGTDRLRRVGTVSTQHDPTLGGDWQSLLVQSFQTVLALRTGNWKQEVLVRIGESSEPMHVAQFYGWVGEWLERFREACRRFDRHTPVNDYHHVVNAAEAILIASVR